SPMLGVKDALPPAGGTLAPCVLVAMTKPQAAVDFDRLWLDQNSILKTGNDPGSLGIVADCNYLVVAIERGDSREDWRGMPKFAPHEEAFDAAIRDKALDRPTLETRLTEVFKTFDDDLSTSPDLTDKDKDRIRGEVIQGLRVRVDRRFGQQL